MGNDVLIKQENISAFALCKDSSWIDAFLSVLANQTSCEAVETVTGSEDMKI